MRVINKFILIVVVFSFFVISSVYANEYKDYNGVSIQILNKITGKVTNVNVAVNRRYTMFDDLQFIVRACYRTSKRYERDNVMFIQVAEQIKQNQNFLKDVSKNEKISRSKIEYIYKYLDPKIAIPSDFVISDTERSKTHLIFSGWMFSNYKEISSIENPIYDISIKRCLN